MRMLGNWQYNDNVVDICHGKNVKVDIEMFSTTPRGHNNEILKSMGTGKPAS